MQNYAFIFPGQGAQVIGMGKDFFDDFSVSKRVFEEADDLLKYKLSDIIFSGPKDKLALTENCQLAIFVNSIALLKAIQEVNPTILPKVCAGLSLGEYTALYAANKLDFENLIYLIQKRARLMDEACHKNQGTMAAVIGMDYDALNKAIKELEDVWIANLNTPTQIVISGKKTSIEKAKDLLKEKGARRVLLLDVQGAFHSPYMKYAEDRLKNDILNMDFLQSDIDLVMNYSAGFVQDIGNLKTNLIKQIGSTIRWCDSIKAIDEKVDLFIEIGCGKTLTNMNKKIEVKTKSISIEKTKDLKELDHAFEK